MQLCNVTLNCVALCLENLLVQKDYVLFIANISDG